jgi:RsiW-degrading membrane proteinase PrsW (M82 family)
VPSVLIFLWLRNRRPDEPLYTKSCNSAFIRGLISVLPVIGLSGLLFILNIVLKLTVLGNSNTLIYKAIYNFIVLAFAEEIVKFVLFRLLLKKKLYSYTFADVVTFMVIIGLAFGLIEDLPYAIGADPITMLVRGFTMGHVSYGFIMGYFYGKRLYTGKKQYGIISLLLPWILHGIYDFSLTPELMKLNDNLVFIAIIMVIIDIVTLVLMFRFFIKAKKQDKEYYHQPLLSDTDL